MSSTNEQNSPPASPSPALSNDETTNAHLSRMQPDARNLLSATLAERVAHMRSDRFIMHEDAKAVLRAMKRILESPGGERPRCAAIIGDSNSGKTAVVNHFFSLLGGGPAQRLGTHGQVPIVVVEAPGRCTAPKLELEIARALGEPFSPSMKPRELSVLVLRSLHELGTKMLIVQEFQHIEPIPPAERQVVYDTLKSITNRGIHVVVVGTRVVDRLRREDTQILNRFRPLYLHGFARKDAAFTNFLATQETHYPLPEQSGLWHPRLADLIYSRTGGVMGEVVVLCNAAAVHAVENGLPCIGEDSILNNEDYIEIEGEAAA